MKNFVKQNLEEKALSRYFIEFNMQAKIDIYQTCSKLDFLQYQINYGFSFSIIIEDNKNKIRKLDSEFDFTCRNQLQQTLHVCQFQQVCVSSNSLSLQ